MHTSPGDSAHPPNPIDWDAYGRLQQRSQAVQTSFDLNGIERGLSRLLQHPKRESSGAILAKRLERDARKFLRNRGNVEVLLGDLETPARRSDPTEMEARDLEAAVRTVKAGLRRLDARHHHALTAKALDQPPEALGIKGRQRRNLARAAREEVSLEPGIVDAYDLLRDGLTLWRFFTVDLCAPLLTG